MLKQLENQYFYLDEIGQIKMNALVGDVRTLYKLFLRLFAIFSEISGGILP